MRSFPFILASHPNVLINKKTFKKIIGEDVYNDFDSIEKLTV